MIKNYTALQEYCFQASRNIKYKSTLIVITNQQFKYLIILYPTLLKPFWGVNY